MILTGNSRAHLEALHLLFDEAPEVRAVGVDMLGGEGAPPGLQGADPSLHAGNMNGCSRVRQIRVVGVQRVGDEPVLLQGAVEDAGQRLTPPYAHPDGRGCEAVEQHR